MGYVRIMWVGANLLALIPLAPLFRSKDLRLGRLHAAIAFTIMFSELVSWLLFLGLSVVTFSPACRGGGFLLKNPSGFSIDRLSPHALWFARFMSRATR